MSNIKWIERLRRMSLVEVRFRRAQKLRIGLERMTWTWTRNGSHINPSSGQYYSNSPNIADPKLRSALAKDYAAA